MCLIYNSINYRRNVVGLEAVAGNPNAIVLFSRSSRCRHQGALRVCYDSVSTEEGSMEDVMGYCGKHS